MEVEVGEVSVAFTSRQILLILLHWLIYTQEPQNILSEMNLISISPFQST